jgi:hypothetical protein
VHKRREARGLTSIGKQVRLVYFTPQEHRAHPIPLESWLGQRTSPQPHACPLDLEETQYSQPSSLPLIVFFKMFSIRYVPAVPCSLMDVCYTPLMSSKDKMSSLDTCVIRRQQSCLEPRGTSAQPHGGRDDLIEHKIRPPIAFFGSNKFQLGDSVCNVVRISSSTGTCFHRGANRSGTALPTLLSVLFSLFTAKG